MDPVRGFTDLVRRPTPPVDLAEAALVIGAVADPGLRVGAWLDRLDQLAAGIQDLAGLRRRLFTELGLRGNVRRYADPANSFLHLVLTRRVGIPISLSVVVLEVGRRAGVHLEGVGMPGHFLVRDPATGILLDAFAGGVQLDLSDAEARFRATTGSTAPFGPALLPTVSSLQILSRMLLNLREVYRRTGAAVELEQVARMRLALPGAGDPADALLLGEALGRQGRFGEAADELERRAASAPGPVPLRAAARALRARLS